MIKNGSRHSKMFSYVPIPSGTRRHFCLQQNILRLAWVIFHKETSFAPHDRSDSCPSVLMNIGRRIRRFAGLLRSNVKILREFWRLKRRGLKENRLVELPCFGQLCLPVHQGFKVFDFFKKVVTKVFDQDVPHAIVRHEINVLKDVSDLGFATSIRRWNVDERWYEEEYMPGVLDSSYIPLDTKTLIDQFSRKQVHLLTGLIRCRPQKWQQVREYVLEIKDLLPLGDWPDVGKEAQNVQSITSFLDATIMQLQPEGDRIMVLAFSHGDFVPANMLTAKDGVKLIDWEGAGYRSALYDFYSYFFYRSVSRDIPVRILLNEVQRALPLFLSELVQTKWDVARSVSDMASVYRRTFYVEMIVRLVNRALSDRNLPIFHYLNRYLRIFMCYEEMLPEYSMSGSSSTHCQNSVEL